MKHVAPGYVDREATSVADAATDISDAAVKQASRGAYRTAEIQRGMKPELLHKYFIGVSC